MTGPEHYREAENRLLMAWEDDRHPDDTAHLVAEAQVHATLALAAATAIQPSQYSRHNPETREWQSTVGAQEVAS